MYGFVLQDWATVGATGVATIIQNESDWLAFSSFQDIAFWIDIRSVSAGTTTIKLQTSPTKDDVLFQDLTNCSAAVATGSTTISLVKNILSTNPGVPLATWVRWSLATTATSTTTFRILASANRVAA